jgi:hypothetical protein
VDVRESVYRTERKGTTSSKYLTPVFLVWRRKWIVVELKRIVIQYVSDSGAQSGGEGKDEGETESCQKPTRQGQLSW